MNKLMIIALMLIGFQQMTFAQKNNIQKVTIQTSAECNECKMKLEEVMNYTKGVQFAELNLDNKVLTVKFNSSKISLADVKKKIVNAGYDADELKANKEQQMKLPKCCQPGGMEGHGN